MLHPHMVPPGDPIRLKDIDPRYTGDYENKSAAKADLKKDRKRLIQLQELLYAEGKRSLLIILQGMDTSGKDGTIKHVMRGVNPQGCVVTSFKVPTHQELAHDFLWRVHKAVPAKGMIGIFNRSHYEDVLVVRVHNLVPRKVWEKRYDQINAFERTLAENDTVILKFFLHISKEEQKRRLQARLDQPHKRWKFNPADLRERALWDKYVAAYEDAINRCSTEWAPWYVIPADHKWYRNLVIARVIADTLERLDMHFPEPAEDLEKITIPD
ncbi:MAG: polyphosphate kinase 2 family protein [Chloroflexi bacterium]|nr:polyphosphate kinase 2 family protein [Chloroflexota bacterium]